MTNALPSNDRIAICLSASFLGFFAHIGFLETLVAAGITPAHVTGASAGAYVAALYAAGLPPARIREIIMDPKMVLSFWDWLCVLRGFPMLVNLRGFTGLLSGRHALARLRDVIGDRRIEDCETAELSLAVANLTHGQSEIITAGPIADFVAASWSVPGLFAGARVGDSLYWDGGIANGSPVTHLLDDPTIDTIIIHTADHPEHTELAHRGTHFTIADGINVAHSIILKRVQDLTVQLAEAKGKRLVHYRSIYRRPKFGDHSDRRHLVDTGAATAARLLAEHPLRLNPIHSPTPAHAV